MIDSSRYEKNESVLWAFLTDGIVLHNFVDFGYLELNGIEAAIWAYMDGAHSLSDIVNLLKNSADYGNEVGEELNRIATKTFQDLLKGKFVIERRK
jgi:hypothetical protein